MNHSPRLQGLSALSRIRNALAGLLGATALSSTLAMAASAPGSGAPVSSPLTVLELMRASIEVAADGLWAAEGVEKLSAEDWLFADQDAVQLIGAVSLLSRGGT